MLRKLEFVNQDLFSSKLDYSLMQSVDAHPLGGISSSLALLTQLENSFTMSLQRSGFDGFSE